MNEADLKFRDQHNNLLRWTVLTVAAAMLCVSLVELISAEPSKFLILGVAAAVAVLIARFDLPIPRTRATFYPKTVFAFWGVAWLGVFGGVLLALASSASSGYSAGSDKKDRISHIARDIVCAFAAGLAFHLSVSAFGGHQTTIVAGSFLIPNEIVFAACVMAFVHFAAGAGLDLIEAKFSQRTSLDREVFDRLVTFPSTGHLASLAVAIVIFLTFNHFGIEFGLVLLPLAIGANAAYRIHIRSLDQKTKEILEASRIHLATVEALATAIDARDQVGVGHVRRTQIYAVGLGRVMNLPDGEIDALRTGALLHDIGKLAVPDHILNKPGRLTQAEMEKTKIHSSVGASILEKVGFPMPVVPTVKYHHEFWDGSGYPEGLRGSQIPLTARILSVADAFDTLRGARPYRPAISRDDALSFMRAGSGTQFDPNIVDILIRNLRAFEDEISAEGLGYYSGSGTQHFAGDGFVEQIKQANREVFTLYSLAREFGAAMSLNDTLSLFARKVGELVPYDACGVFLLDEMGEFATPAYVAGRSSALIAGMRVKAGEGATGYALQKNKSVENVDPALDLMFCASDTDLDFRTMMSRPLVAEDRVIGAISLYTSELDQYQDEHIRLLETVAKIAADAIAKSVLHAEAATNALTDPITGLPNARALRLEFEKEVKRAERSDATFQILMLDLDGFKAVNDNYGHKVGDLMLTGLGGVIRAELRDYDFLARYAGDEFVALVPDTDSVSVQELCKRIQAAVTEFGVDASPGEVANVGVSIGASSFPAGGRSFDQLIIAADKAMYLEKALRKQKQPSMAKNVDVATLLAPPPTAEEYMPVGTQNAVGEDEPVGMPSGEMLVVELDESHVISTSSVN